MYTKKIRGGAKWLTGILMTLCLTFLSGPSILAQDLGLGDIPLHPDIYQKHLKIFPDFTSEALPLAYDARAEGIVTPAKNQGSCGSCWAFASVGAMESHLAYNIGLTDQSEQQQVSCNVKMSGCCGGSSSAIRYWEKKGPISETCFPYYESDTSCPIIRTVKCKDAKACEQLSQRVVNWHTVASNQYKTSLYNDGPSYWRFNVYSDFFPFWTTGDPGDVYVHSTGGYEGGHAVLLIGWDDSKGAYLCKNSWGAEGGPNGDGTFWIAYAEQHVQDLGFGMSNFDLTVTACDNDEECEEGENCLSCPNDCPGKQTGKPSERFCCGDGLCEGLEDPYNCAIDCSPPE